MACLSWSGKRELAFFLLALCPAAIFAQVPGDGSLDRPTDVLPVVPDEDNCDPMPCKNGGRCVDYPAGYRCECPVRFRGRDCDPIESDVTEWGPWSRCTVTCGSSGRQVRLRKCLRPFYDPVRGRQNACKLILSDYRQCPVEPACTTTGQDANEMPPNETGTDLTGPPEIQTVVPDEDNCDPMPCKNGGRCVDYPAGYRCECPLRFRGRDCDPIEDDVTAWGPWSSCPVTCGSSGRRVRSRTCLRPFYEPVRGKFNACKLPTTQFGKCPIKPTCPPPRRVYPPYQCYYWWGRYCLF